MCSWSLCLIVVVVVVVPSVLFPHSKCDPRTDRCSTQTASTKSKPWERTEQKSFLAKDVFFRAATGCIYRLCWRPKQEKVSVEESEREYDRDHDFGLSLTPVFFRSAEILYVGDHLYSDVLRSKRTLGWRTALVVPEIEDEMIVAFYMHNYACVYTTKAGNFFGLSTERSLRTTGELLPHDRFLVDASFEFDDGGVNDDLSV